MSDPCLTLLVQQLSNYSDKKLWFADEHHGEILPLLTPFKNDLYIISNRYDVAEKANSLGFNCQFNDWTTDSKTPVDAVFLRICKEKPVTNHLIKQAFASLVTGGQLILVGQKNEGVKSYEKIAINVFYGKQAKGKHLKKIGPNYIAAFEKGNTTKTVVDASFRTTDYNGLVEIAQWQDKVLYSKPGVYGWDKIDKGSTLLIESLDLILKQHPSSIESILDLGCGYGFLTLASTHIPCSRRVATDNNAGALRCMKYNAEKNEVKTEVIPADCGDAVSGRFDLILCNPPFHKGFDVDGGLTQQFLLASRNKLNPKGVAVFVVNSFIPIEKNFSSLFKTSKLIINTGQFKVFALTL